MEKLHRQLAERHDTLLYMKSQFCPSDTLKIDQCTAILWLKLRGVSVGI